MSADLDKPHLSTQKNSIINYISLAVCLLAAIGLYADGISNVILRWSVQPEYSHGFFIPLVSLYILWERRQILRPCADRSHYFGLPLILIAFIMLLAGEISALYLLIHYSFLFFLLGISLVFIGRNTQYTLVPIALLAFAIPLPYIIEALLTAKMQLLSSSIGVSIIRLFDIPVYLSGNIIDLGDFQLHVVEACSGLRYLFPLTCVGFVAAYFYNAAKWKRAFIFLSTIPITILLNSARIGLTGVLAEHFGIASAQGFLHDFEGWVVFLICMLILILEIVILERFSDKRSIVEAFQPAHLSVADTEQSASNRSNPSLVVCAVFAIFMLVYVKQLDEREDIIADVASLATFPMSIDEWRGTRVPIEQDIVDELKATDYLIADYYTAGENRSPINLYIAYYENQRKGTSPHSPTVCIPGGGWEISEFSRTILNDMPVNRVIVKRGNNAQLVYYWFVERGEIVANEYKKKWLLLRDALALNRSDGSLIRVVAPIENEINIDKAEERLKQFIAHAHPKIMRYLPEKEVGKDKQAL